MLSSSDLRAYLECDARPFLESHPGEPLPRISSASPGRACTVACRVRVRCPRGGAFAEIEGHVTVPSQHRRQ